MRGGVLLKADLLHLHFPFQRGRGYSIRAGVKADVIPKER